MSEWLDREELIKRIKQLEPKYQNLDYRRDGELYHIYKYLINKQLKNKVVNITPVKVEYDCLEEERDEEYLYPEEFLQMYPDGSIPTDSFKERKTILNLEEENTKKFL